MQEARGQRSNKCLVSIKHQGFEAHVLIHINSELTVLQVI